MGDEFESEISEDAIMASITPRKFTRADLLVLWLQYRAHKKLVRADFYASVASAVLLHRAYQDQRQNFHEGAALEMEMLMEGEDGFAN